MTSVGAHGTIQDGCTAFCKKLSLKNSWMRISGAPGALSRWSQFSAQGRAAALPRRLAVFWQPQIARLRQVCGHQRMARRTEWEAPEKIVCAGGEVHAPGPLEGRKMQGRVDSDTRGALQPSAAFTLATSSVSHHGHWVCPQVAHRDCGLSRSSDPAAPVTSCIAALAAHLISTAAARSLGGHASGLILIRHVAPLSR
jgi:hypothetical protein